MSVTPTAPAASFDGQTFFAVAPSTSQAVAATAANPGGLIRARIALSSAQILALLGTPITIANAPGPGFTIVPVASIVTFVGGSIAYTNAGGAVGINVGSRTSALAESFITTVSPNSTHQITPLAAAQSTAANPPTDENAPMTISKITNNYAAGNGTAVVVVYYTVESSTGL